MPVYLTETKHTVEYTLPLQTFTKITAHEVEHCLFNLFIIQTYSTRQTLITDIISVSMTSSVFTHKHFENGKWPLQTFVHNGNGQFKSRW